MISTGTGRAGGGDAAAAAWRALRAAFAAGWMALAALLLPAGHAAAQEANSVRSLHGELPVGGRFLMAIPDQWQPGGGLIIYNRGFTLVDAHLQSDPQLAPEDAVLLDWLQRGYAVIAGTYAQRGWAVFSLATFQRQLLQRFVDEAGQPGRIVLVGGSFGGLVAVKTAEYLVADSQPVAGVLALCAPLAGTRTWDRAADLKLVYDQVCKGVGGGSIDRGSPAPGWVMSYEQVPPDWGDLDDLEVQRLFARITQCTGVLLPEFARSDSMRERLQTIADVQGVDVTGRAAEERFIVNMSYASFALADLVRGPDKLRGASPFDNLGIDHGDGVLADVERVSADPFARAELSVLSDPSWRLGDARLLALHTSGDEIVVPEHLSELRAPMQDNPNIAAALVVEEVPSHCEFEAAEFGAAFDALDGWIDGAAAPTPDSLDARCEQIAAVIGGSCRFADPSVLDDYDTRVPPRQLVQHAAVSAPQSGAWYDPDTNGEGFFVQVLPDGRAAVAWYTYAPDGSGEQRWITGVGLVQDNAILVQDARLSAGGGFGTAFDPASVEQTPFGQLTFVFEGTQAADPDLRLARVRYEGPEGWGEGVRELVQLSHDGCGVDAGGCDPAALPLHGYSGLWFRGNDAPGDGLFLQVDDSGLAVIAWYLFLPDGTPMWLIGTQAVSGDPDQVQFTLERATGARFGEGFDAADVMRSNWGAATLRFESCGSATLSWDANDPALADGAIALQRLTAAPAGSACAD